MSTRFVRPREACARLGIGRSTLYRLIQTGELGPLVKVIPGDAQSPSALIEENLEKYQQKIIELAEGRL